MNDTIDAKLMDIVDDFVRAKIPISRIECSVYTMNQLIKETLPRNYWGLSGNLSLYRDIPISLNTSFASGHFEIIPG